MCQDESFTSLIVFGIAAMSNRARAEMPIIDVWAIKQAFSKSPRHLSPVFGFGYAADLPLSLTTSSVVRFQNISLYTCDLHSVSY